MRSGELARATCVSTDTLRHYERLGLLPIPRRSVGNYRDYPSASAERVQLIRRALQIGFWLGELKTILSLRDRGGRPCQQVRGMLDEKIRNVQRQITNLILMRAELRRISKDWDRRLSRSQKGQAARLLENLPGDLHAACQPPFSRSTRNEGA